MTQYTGTVSRLFQARRGGSFGLENQPNVYFNTRDALPGWLQPGVVVSFTAEVGRNGNPKSQYVTDSTLRQETARTPPPPTQQSSYSSKTDNAIRYQSARKDALTMVGLLLANGALPLGSVTSKKAGIIEDAVDRFTAVYYEDIETLGALDRVPIDAPQPKETPAPSDGLPE